MFELRIASSHFRIRPYAAAVGLVVAALAAALVFRRLPHANLSLLFLLAVLVVAARWGLWPSIFASVLSFLCLNFFFTAPYYTLTVEEEADLATLVFFLAMAALTGKLAARMRTEMARSRAAVERVSTLLDFSRRMAAAADAGAALAALTDRLARLCECRAAALLPDERGRLRLRAHSPPAPEAPPVLDRSTVERIWENGNVEPVTTAGARYMPLGTSAGRVGLAMVDGTGLSEAQTKLVDGLCEQASIAVERTRLVDELREAQLVSETEQLRSALLSSVSHDLRTPLASIVGSATSLIEYGERLAADDRRELLETVLNEAQRLDRYIQNLLDMTRFGNRQLELRREWVDVNDLISAAIERLGGALSDVDLVADVSPEAALVFVHGALIEQALVNLLDNAADFAPPHSDIRIVVRRAGDTIVVDVIDEGPGIASAERARVFDMFYRVRGSDSRRQGAGLGLAICRSVVCAHGGSVEALPGPGQGGAGTCMRIRLPAAEAPASAFHG